MLNVDHSIMSWLNMEISTYVYGLLVFCPTATPLYTHNNLLLLLPNFSKYTSTNLF
jgi:hypothetical protein